MQLDYGLKLETTQKLIMTPQLRQAIAILQLPATELAELVEKELLENPVLETVSEGGDEPVMAPEPEPSPRDDDSPMEADGWMEYLLNGTRTASGMQQENPERTERREIADAATVSLQDYLEMQLHFSVFTARHLRIGKYLIGSIDDNGYLCGTVAEVAARLKVAEADVASVLKMIQTFDPPGVGAGSLQECLLIQLAMKPEKDTPVYKLAAAVIEDHLAQIASGRYRQIADALHCTMHEVQQAVDIIRTLDPKPGRAFGGSQPGYIVPDIIVERLNNEYVIQINDNYVPQLSINSYYRQIVREEDNDARKYVESRIHAAVWLIKSIEQRRRTLYNVTESIIRLQSGFFEQGPRFLRPLTMKKVAEQVGVHESTVSRATANKYMATPHGVFAMNTFFSSGIQSAGGEDVSASRVKQEIKELIAAEDHTQPLSDQALSDILHSKGIMVSRRTVAKYREELGIAASSKRKRH
ncbi:RNA polymerase factor sigma-54 [Sporomusa acidovorans]|uniref:RNA polymerase sigma-54 factor n=1 Tax=Sporomusa acidovorans (strain ATCC 49682 / DSM 3132 / Mol) TaxID=1123286 RepID=A0ABZ3J6H4_SPOA4|nr:RNA polymerase factor sigma-54 [Sporomusa acidovorans]OZC24063.1 RNA polymerase sigma-54 factor [Sporomusa acidovorans DSM 3132]SDF59407.1 RNA polymerase, sigma 54 subunit, RpoN/SigL [Sporomusa acidovorans]